MMVVVSRVERYDLRIRNTDSRIEFFIRSSFLPSFPSEPAFFCSHSRKLARRLLSIILLLYIFIFDTSNMFRTPGVVVSMSHDIHSKNQRLH